MTFGQAFRKSYSGSFAFVAACPILFLIPVLFEMLQHIVEVKIGMYESVAAAKSTEHHGVRMVFGMLKIISLTLSVYWVTRFLAWRRPDTVWRADPNTFILFGGYLLFQLTLAALSLFAVPQSAPFLLTFFLIAHAIQSLLLGWAVASPLGNKEIGPMASIGLMWRHLPWTFAFTFIAMLPLMVPHYGLTALAVAGPKALLWPTLVVDALLVGVLAPVLVGNGYFAALRAATKQKARLIPSAQ